MGLWLLLALIPTAGCGGDSYDAPAPMASALPSPGDATPSPSPQPSSSPSPAPLDPNTPIVRREVAVLPSDGTVQVGDLGADGTLTITGAVPPLVPGSVIVSGQGRGLLRRVSEVVSAGSGMTIVRTESAQLTDVFEKAKIRFQRDIAIDDLDPASLGEQNGVTISAPTRSRTNGSRGGRDVATELKFEIKFTEEPIEVAGSVTTRLSVSTDFEIDSEAVRDAQGNPAFDESGYPITRSYIRDFSYVQSVGGDVAVNLTARKKGDLFTPRERHLRHFEARPITFFVGIVPVVLTPEFDLVCAIEASVEGGFTCEVKGTTALESGMLYHREGFAQEGVWSGLVNPSASAEGTLPHFYGTAKAACTPLRLDSSFTLWNVNPGATLKIHLPKIEGELRTDVLSVNGSTSEAGGSGLTPVSLKASLSLLLSASASFEIKIGNLVDLPGFEYTRETKYPLWEKTLLPGAGNVEVN